MLPDAEVRSIGATLEAGFTLTLQSEYHAATRQERTTTDDRPPGIIGQTQKPPARDIGLGVTQVLDAP
jgi:hypothetical protein